MISESLKKELIESYIRDGYWKRDTFSSKLSELAALYKEHTAITDGTRSICYRELDELASKGAKFFYDSGIRPHDKVIVQLPNILEFAESVFALSRLGAVPVLALPAHRSKEIRAFISAASAKGYVVSRNHLGFDYSLIADEVENSTDCRVFYSDTIEESFRCSPCSPEAADSRQDPFSPAVLLVSGGTTGIPKLIPRTHADYLYDASVFAQKCFFNSDTVYLAAIPVAHNFSFANPGMIGTLLSGGKVVLASSGSPDELFWLIESEKANVTSMVPSLLILCAEMAEWEMNDISSLKTVLVGGAPITEEQFIAAGNALNCKIRQVYGTAEGLNTITDEDMDAVSSSRCQGKPISSGDMIRIAAADGSFLPTGEEGELLLRGPYTIMNYYERPDADAVSFREDGFYCTGDSAFVDADGNLHVTGRTKEQINKCGEKIMPSEVEDLLLRHSDINDAAVVGIADAELGCRIAAYIISDREIDADEVRRYMKEQNAAPYKWPDEVIMTDSFPLTAVGKVDKKKLRSMYEENHIK